MSPTTYDTWLVALREDNESLPSVEEQQAFLNFLNQRTTAEEAALAYTHVVTNAKYQDPDTLWLLLWQTAEEWPETYQRLVDLLKAIARLPPITRKTNAGEVSMLEYWNALPEFEFGLREYWDGKATRVLFATDPSVHANFINLTSFNACLYSEGVFQLERWAIMTLSAALEQDYESQSHLLDTFTPAAAQYILQTGQSVYTNVKDAGVYTNVKDVIFPGPLLQKAREKGNIERWAFWKENFASVQDQEDLKESTRAIAKQVVERMGKIEKHSH
ncbi:hypothetical protein IMSHALPRED_006471 [Imshaugia aleurites]|uniref:Uncharacterized protein n=1 Tax=Imshaugia aleurites TaxID=172621 RepID=A0A8H3IS74_9LECA|nr:hypothetical protein IMSHALPRED_006471 [Imshaugia aleurites]